MARNRYSIGLVIAVIGIVLLLGKLGVFGFFWGLLWPLFILGAGLLLHMLFFGKMLPSGVLIPGGILITISLMFLFCNLFGWGAMAYLWPGFLFSVAVGLYEYYLFDKYKPRAAYTAALVLALVAALFFIFTLLFSLSIYFIALVLIIGGLAMVWRRPNRRFW